MTSANFAKALRTMIRRRPFIPFVIEFHSGASVVVAHPEAVDFRGTVIYFNDPADVPTLFDASSVNRLVGTA